MNIDSNPSFEILEKEKVTIEKVQFIGCIPDWWYGYDFKNGPLFVDSIVRPGVKYEVYDLQETAFPPIMNSKSIWKYIHSLMYVLKGKANFIPFLNSLVFRRYSAPLIDDANTIFGPFIFSWCRLVYNNKFFKFLESKREKSVLFWTDSIDLFSTYFARPDYTKAMIKRIDKENFDYVFTHSGEDLKYSQKIKYAGWPAAPNFKYFEDLAKKSEFYAPGKYEISGMGNYVKNIKKGEALKSAIPRLANSGLKYGFKYTNYENCDKIDEINKFNNLPELRDQPGGDFVNRITNTNCVLHITGSDYSSLPHPEAARAGKKLMTDASIIKEEPWYTPELVRVVDAQNITDKDIDWAKKRSDEKFPNPETLEFGYFIDKLLGFVK
jgi:hypothetical protein